MVGLQRIHAFIEQYELGDPPRLLTRSERQLIEDALVVYLINEQWNAPRITSRGPAVIRALGRLAAHVPSMSAGRTLRLAAACLSDTLDRLERSEDANHIMQEQLVMLSETIRQLRQPRAG